MEDTGRSLCVLMWGSGDFGFGFKSSEGRSRGILSLWDKNVFTMKRKIIDDHAIWLEGEWGEDRIRVILVNVYVSCETRRKFNLWKKLTVMIESNKDERLCVMGDFNAVRDKSERRGTSENSRGEEIDAFNDFISESELMDLPFQCRKFTWTRLEGEAMSRLDRFLVSEAWITTWPTRSQWCLEKNLSDYCPLLLRESNHNWGPAPFRMLNCWKDVEGYHKFVKEQWGGLQVNDWGMYVLKEKFKQIKLRLKEWRKNHTQNLGEKILVAKEEFNRLEIKGETEVLSEEETHNKRVLTATVHRLSNLNCSIQWKKVRSRWLKEGDANTKYFHGCVNKRRKNDEVLCLKINNRRITEVENLKNAVFEHFQSHFAAREARPTVYNIEVKRLDENQSAELVKEFSEEEIRQAVWDCDNSKSLGPDGVNFGFIKEFWEDLTPDFL